MKVTKGNSWIRVDGLSGEDGLGLRVGLYGAEGAALSLFSERFLKATRYAVSSELLFALREIVEWMEERLEEDP